MSQVGIPCSVMRGGTSKGLVFRSGDLPLDRHERDRLLLAAMGSPDPREIDGMGGGHPLTSKVAVVSPTERVDVDVEYLFLQVWPDRPEVSDSQNCGNMLAAVGPFAIESGFVEALDGVTPVRIWMTNTETIATAYVQTPGRHVCYEGNAHIDGVPGTHAPIEIEFADIAGSSTGALLPTGRARDTINGVDVTCIDNGMPVVCMRASDFGLTGNESPAELESMTELTERVEAIRLIAGPRMNLGDVSGKSVPKMSLLSPPTLGGDVGTRTFIPHRVHDAIGVLGAVSVATACLIRGSVAHDLVPDRPADHVDLQVEHPTGFFTVGLDVARAGETIAIDRVTLLRTARLLMRGEVFVTSDRLAVE